MGANFDSLTFYSSRARGWDKALVANKYICVDVGVDVCVVCVCVYWPPHSA